MRLTKRHSLLIASLVFAGFTCVAYLSLAARRGPSVKPQTAQSGLSTTSSPTAVLPPSEPDPGSKFVLDRFHRTESRDGRTIWEITAARGQYFPESNSAKVEDAQLSLYRKDGEVIELTAGAAVIYMEGTTLSRAVASSGVQIKLDRSITATSDQAEFFRSENAVLIPGAVRIHNDRMVINGKKLRVDLNEEKFHLADAVDTVINPHSSR